jgi:hypothetical protein
MAPASFPEIESPSLRKSGVVLESEELRSSAIGQTSRDVGHATNLLNDEFFFDCDWRAENITFREHRGVSGKGMDPGGKVISWPIVIG